MLTLGIGGYVFISQSAKPPLDSRLSRDGARKFQPAVRLERTEEPDAAKGIDFISPSPIELLQQAINSNDPLRQQEAVEKLLPACVITDADVVAHWVGSLPAGPLRVRALQLLAQKWGGNNPQAALKWATWLPDPAERQAALGDTCLGIAQKDPHLAIQSAGIYRLQDQAVWASLAQQWAETNTPAALSWVVQQAPGVERDRLLQHIVFVESKADPVQAARLAIEKIPPGDMQDEAVISVLQQWRQKDLPAATAWVRQFPEGELHDRALAEVEGVAASRALPE